MRSTAEENVERIDIAGYLRPLRKWWWLIVGATLIAALSSFLYTRTLPTLFRSHATLMVGGGTIQDPNPQGSEIYLAQTLAGLYADLASRVSVAGAVMDALDLGVMPEYSISAIPQTPLLEIAVLDTDPVRAQAVTVELVNQLILLSPAGQEEQQQQAFIDEQLQRLQTSIRAAQDEITRKGDELASALSAREIQTIGADIAALEEKVVNFQANYAALLSKTEKGAANRVSVLESASLPMAPVPSQALLTILLAAVVGGALGVGTAYLLEYLEDSITDSVHVEQLGMTSLAVTPTLATRGDDENRLVMLVEPHSAAAEAFRILRLNLQYVSVDQPLSVIQVTSPSPREGKSLTAANLAIAVAQFDARVILIDADLHRPSQHRYFEMLNNVGLTSALLGDPDLIDGILRPTALPNLRLLTSGPLPPNPAELLGSMRMKALLDKLKAKADVIVVDSPPVNVVSDSVGLARTVDGVLLVFRSGKTRKDAAKRAIGLLRQVHANCLGVVLNGVAAREHGYYGYSREYAQLRYRNAAVTRDSESPPKVPLPSTASGSQ